MIIVGEKMELSRVRHKESDSADFLKKIHKVYLLLAITIGVMLSLFMPLFNEPDGQYHYTVATNMVGLTNDISAYGEENISTGMTAQISSYRSGEYFETYFKNKIVKMPMGDLPRGQVQQIPSFKTYDFWGHIVPAAGVWLGYQIYPSMGVMIVVARLLSTLVFSLLLFFIIRFLEKGKLFFFALSLTPVITNSISSLSYDALTYVLAAFSVAIAINIVNSKKITKVSLIQIAVAAISLFLGAKTNIKLFILLFPLVIIGVIFYNRLQKVEDFVLEKCKKKLVKFSIIAGGLATILGGILFVYITHPGWFFYAYRFVLNFAINMNPIPNTQQIFTGLLAVPNARYNNMPLWVSGAWYVLLVLIAFSEEKFVESKIISFGSLALFFVGILAVYYSYMPYYVASTLRSLDILGRIGGHQGRYFTPTLLLFVLFVGSTKFKARFFAGKSLLVFSVCIIIISNVLLVFGTLFGMINGIYY